MKKLLIVIFGIGLGVILGYWLVFYTSLFPFRIQESQTVLINPLSPKKQVIGFLPYWLLDKASTDYSRYINTLTYFGLRIDTDGTIQKFTSETQEEPGWNALRSGRVDSFFQEAQKQKVSLSLLISSGSNESINRLMDDPIGHADNFVKDIGPVIDKYGFKDLNLDIEYTEGSTPESQTKFISFVKEVKKGLKNPVTLTIEISTSDVIRSGLINPKAIGEISDNVVLMAYDFHSTDSFVTGPVAPISGAGTISEYDVTAATEKALQMIPSGKLILGIPLYGYEWESLTQEPRSAVIPGSGVVASNRRAEDALSSCSGCVVSPDKPANEKYISFPDSQNSVFHTIFYPDKSSTISKINLVNNLKLGGVALWALGYEGNSILSPLINYKE